MHLKSGLIGEMVFSGSGSGLIIWRNYCTTERLIGLGVRIEVLNATFNNILAIWWLSVLLVEETRIPEKTTGLSQVTDKFYHNPLHCIYNICNSGYQNYSKHVTNNNVKPIIYINKTQQILDLFLSFLIIL